MQWKPMVVVKCEFESNSLRTMQHFSSKADMSMARTVHVGISSSHIFLIIG